MSRSPDYCMGCDEYREREEILKYDEYGRGIECEFCVEDEAA